MFILVLAIAIMLNCKKSETIIDGTVTIQDSSKVADTVTPAKVDEKAAVKKK